MELTNSKFLSLMYIHVCIPTIVIILEADMLICMYFCYDFPLHICQWADMDILVLNLFQDKFYL